MTSLLIMNIRLMNSADEEKQTKGLNMLDQGMLTDPTSFLLENELRTPAVFARLFNFITSSNLEQVRSFLLLLIPSVLLVVN